jgi:hypothetical protein
MKGRIKKITPLSKGKTPYERSKKAQPIPKKDKAK